MTKIDIIKQRISEVKYEHPFTEESKRDLITYYTEVHKERVEKLDEQEIKAWDFSPEVIVGAQRLVSYYEIKDMIKHIEVHTYAPELNTAVFKDGTEHKVPYCTSFDQAVMSLVCEGKFQL